HRAEQMALLARLTHEMLTAPRIGELLDEVKDHPQVKLKNSHHAANYREIRRSFDRAVKLPKELVEELARVTTRAQQAWQEARQPSVSASFRPWLKKFVSRKPQQANAMGSQSAQYDALLDESERGATTAETTKVFAELREELVPLIGAI